MRRLLPLPVVAAVTAAVTGCGSSSTSDPLDNALSYMPKNAPVVVAIDTNLNSDQAKNVGKLIDKFGPIGTQFKNGLRHGIQSGSRNLDFDKDIKPQLGNDLVVGIPDAASLNSSDTPTIEAIKTKDGGKAKSLVAKGSTKVGSSHGADIYKDSSAKTFTAVQGDTIVGADTRPLLEGALARQDGGDHMTKDDFDKALGDLDKSAIVRVAGNLQTILQSSPKTAKARKIQWVSALRQFGATASARDNGVAIDFQAQTDGNLKDSDLPIASGSAPPPVVKRPGEVGIGIRSPQQIYNFAIAALQATDPKQFGEFEAGKQQIGSKLGVNVDRDILGQLTGNSSISVVPNSKNKFAARAQLKDPAAFKAALAKSAKGLPALAKQFGGGTVAISTPKGGNGFYALADAKTKQKLVFGVVRNAFVIATDPKRAAAFAVQSASTVPGAKGSVVLDIDTRTLVNQQLRRSGVTPLAQAFTGALGDFVGYLKADASSVRGNFTLKING